MQLYVTIEFKEETAKEAINRALREYPHEKMFPEENEKPLSLFYSIAVSENEKPIYVLGKFISRHGHLVKHAKFPVVKGII